MFSLSVSVFYSRGNVLDLNFLASQKPLGLVWKKPQIILFFHEFIRLKLSHGLILREFNLFLKHALEIFQHIHTRPKLLPRCSVMIRNTNENNFAHDQTSSVVLRHDPWHKWEHSINSFAYNQTSSVVLHLIRNTNENDLEVIFIHFRTRPNFFRYASPWSATPRVGISVFSRTNKVLSRCSVLIRANVNRTWVASREPGRYSTKKCQRKKLKNRKTGNLL